MTRDESYKDLYEKAKNTFPPEQKRQNEIRIYLSGPITGVPDYKEKFEAAKADIEDKAWGWGYDITREEDEERKRVDANCVCDCSQA